METQERAAHELERLKHGEASHNDIRRENGLEPVPDEGADGRYRAKEIGEIRVPLKIDVRPATETASKLREITKTARQLYGLIEELDQGFKVDVDFADGGEGMEGEKTEGRKLTGKEMGDEADRMLFEQMEHLAKLAKKSDITDSGSQEAYTRAMCEVARGIKAHRFGA